MSFLHRGVLEVVVKPHSIRGEPMTRWTNMCSVLTVTLLYEDTFLYDKEWDQKLASSGWEAGLLDFLQQVECCTRVWERLLPGIFKRWA